MSNFIVILVLGLIIWAVYRYFISPKAPAVDYSFGNEQLKKIISLLKTSRYEDAINAIRQLDSDDLTQACDNIALSLDEKSLLNIHERSSDKNITGLILGVYYSHQAWKARGKGYADSVSSNQADLFSEYLSKSAEYLKTAISDKFTSAEANSRLVRVYMGLDETDEAGRYFTACRNEDRNHLWNYIHYAELIQPKWGGEIKNIKPFFESLPDNDLIKTVIRLKLLYDGYSVDQNYFDPQMDTDNSYGVLKSEFMKVDSANAFIRMNSVHRYVVFGYMFLISELLGEKQLSQKYWKLLDGKLPLYPFGLQ